MRTEKDMSNNTAIVRNTAIKLTFTKLGKHLVCTKALEFELLFPKIHEHPRFLGNKIVLRDYY